MAPKDNLNDYDDLNVSTSQNESIPVSMYFQWPFIKVGRSIKSMVDGYKRIFNLEPEDLKAMYLKKVRAADLRGDVQKCMKFMQILASKYPDDPDIFYQLGISCEKASQFGAAIHAYQQVIVLNERYTKAHYRIGIICIRQREFDKAIGALKKANQIDPESAEINFRLGQSYDRIKQYEKAITYFTKAVSLNPKFIQAYKNMALTYDSIDEHKKALDCLKRVLELEETIS